MEISHSSWPWHRSDATALAGYANMMMMMMMHTSIVYYGGVGLVAHAASLRAYLCTTFQLRVIDNFVRVCASE